MSAAEKIIVKTLPSSNPNPGSRSFCREGHKRFSPLFTGNRDIGVPVGPFFSIFSGDQRLPRRDVEPEHTMFSVCHTCLDDIPRGGLHRPRKILERNSEDF